MATFRYILKSGDMGQRALGPMVVISLLFAVACGPVATQVDDAKPSSDSTPARASEAESGLDSDELKAVEDATVVAEEACPKFWKLLPNCTVSRLNEWMMRQAVWLSRRRFKT